MAGCAAVLLAGGLAAAALAAAPTAQAARTAHAAAGQAKAGLSVNWYESAPYYSTLDSSAPDLGQVMAATGQKAFDMAFILADGGSCTPSWDGTDPVSSDTQVSGRSSTRCARRRRRDRLRGRLQRHQARPGLRFGLGDRRRLPAGDHRPTACTRSTSTWRSRRSRTRRRSPTNSAPRRSCSEQPRPVHLDHDAVHHDRRELLRAAVARRGQEPGLHAERLHDHAVRRRLQRRLLAGHRAAGLQRAADEHVRLVQRAGLRPRGLLRHERPDRQRRVLLPERLPDRARPSRRAPG